MKTYQIIKFQDGDFSLNIQVSPDEQTLWLTQDQIAELFGKARSTITEHINNIFSEGKLAELTSVGNSDRSTDKPIRKELRGQTTSCAKNARQVGGQIHHTTFYNLDVIISKINSSEFRILTFQNASAK